MATVGVKEMRLQVYNGGALRCQTKDAGLGAKPGKSHRVWNQELTRSDSQGAGIQIRRIISVPGVKG